MTSFTDRLEQYLAFRRRYGGDWTVAAQNLRPFVVFADAEGAGWITVDLFLKWKDRFGSAGTATWNNRLTSVRSLAAWLKDIDPRTEVPPKGLIPRRYQRPPPYIYSDSEIVRIVTEAARLPSRLGLRSKTYATLFGLLAVTGLRIGEALTLDDRDIDLDTAVLLIRHGKNGRGRFIPVTDCTAERLSEFWISWELDWPHSVLIAKSAIDALSALSLHLMPAERRECAVVSIAAVTPSLPAWIEDWNPRRIFCAYDASGGAGDAFEAAAHHMAGVLGGEQQHGAASRGAEAAQAWDAGGHGDSEVQRQQGFAAFGLTADDADGLLGPKRVHHPLLRLGALLELRRRPCREALHDASP